MRLQLPASRSKYYLTGMDWMIQALDDSCRRRLGGGHLFLIALELKGKLNFDSMSDQLFKYCQPFAVLQSHLSRDFNLAPYWQVREKPDIPKFKTTQHHALNDAEAFARFEAELNGSISHEACYFRVIHISMPAKDWLGFVFDHRIFDARGAELFLRGFQSEVLSCGKEPVKEVPFVPAYLDRWREQFQAGKKINRAWRSQNNPVRALDEKNLESPPATRFTVKSFDESQTRLIFDRANKCAGPFMFLPYSLALSIQAMDALFAGRGRKTGDFVIPVARDLRSPASGFQSHMFFNHLSFLFFRIQPHEIQNRDLLVKVIQEQLYQQVKNKMPESLAEASMLLRIVPRSWLSGRFQERLKNCATSFSFTFLGESAYPYDALLETPVERILHLPKVPPSPGLGIFISQYKNKLNLVLSYLESLMTAEEASFVVESIKL